MGESLYGQDNYGAGNYSQSVYFSLIASATHVELTSASAAIQATLPLVGNVAHIEFGNSSATAALVKMLEGSASIVLGDFEADWEADFFFSASASIEFNNAEPTLFVLLGLEPSGSMALQIAMNNEVPMYGGPYWVDDVPPEQTWTPISSGGFGG